MKTIKKIVPFGFLALPFVAGAAASGTDLLSFIVVAQSVLKALLPVIIGVAVIVLMVGIIRYITAGEDEEKRTKARGLMIYGIIGLFVMVSVWGLVAFLGSAFGIERKEIGTVGGLIP